MRKSSAPSKKFKSPFVGTVQKAPVNENKKLNQTCENVTGVRTTSQILNLLKKKENKQENVEEKCETVVRTPDNSNKIMYNVVLGKKSTKKHKTWEGDGILEITGRLGILKDENGSELGRITNLKTELIEDGYILSIGSKEVQILDLITDKVCFKRPLVEKSPQNNAKTTKKQKTKSSSPLLLNLNTVTKNKRSFSTNYQTFVLPQPTPEHQWTYNINKKPITDVSVDGCLSQVLRPHQKTGVIFLYECVLGYRQLNSFGAILADEMGLGKTLQCISLIWTLLKQGPYGGVPVIKKCLIVTPSSLTGNWEKEFLSWLGREKIKIFIVDNKNKVKDFIKMSHIPVLILSYEMFVRSYDEITEINFDLLICDEGHRLKNNSIKASTLLNQLECQKRIILTGTPIQNDLQEFYSLIDFVNPGFLGSNMEYRKYFEDPIVKSREPNADNDVKKLGEERAKELNQKTKHFILRRTQEILDKYLPTKTEIVVFCKSSYLQQQLYSSVVDIWENRHESNKEFNHLNVIITLKKICNHPSLIRTNTDEISTHLSSNLPNWDEMSPSDSGKLKILLDLLKNIQNLKEKVVIVSSYTQTIDMLSDVCRHHDYIFSRLDGSVPSNQRTKLVDSFNNKYSQSFIFLLSSKAGGVGLNLIGASRLVLFDSDWNPATDLQAMSRIWRDGQKKSVFIYRFLTSGTIEEKIFQRQISKTGLSGTIVDPSSSSIKMSDEELKDLFSPEFNVDCSTHKLLNCECLNNGSIPEPIEDISDGLSDRKCQLGVVKTENNLKMNQLMQWEHHGQPFCQDMLKELGILNCISDVKYIFRNKCNL